MTTVDEQAAAVDELAELDRRDAEQRAYRAALIADPTEIIGGPFQIDTQLLAAMLIEVRAARADLARLEDEIRPLLPFRLGRRR